MRIIGDAPPEVVDEPLRLDRRRERAGEAAKVMLQSLSEVHAGPSEELVAAVTGGAGVDTLVARTGFGAAAIASMLPFFVAALAVGSPAPAALRAAGIALVAVGTAVVLALAD